MTRKQPAKSKQVGKPKASNKSVKAGNSEVSTKSVKVRKPKLSAQYTLGKRWPSLKPNDFDTALKFRSFRSAERDVAREKLSKIVDGYRILYNDYMNVKQYFSLIRGVQEDAKALLDKVEALESYDAMRTECLLPVRQVDEHFDVRSLHSWAIGKFKTGVEKLNNTMFRAAEFNPVKRGPKNRHLVWLVEAVNKVAVEHSDGGYLTMSVTDKPNGDNDWEFLIAILAVADVEFRSRNKQTGYVKGKRSIEDSIEAIIAKRKMMFDQVEIVKDEMKIKNRSEIEIDAFVEFLEQNSLKRDRQKF